MGKNVKTTIAQSVASIPEDPVQKNLNSALNAKKLFVASTVNMGWQLAGTVLIPVFVGVKLDQRYDSSPSYVLAALVLATFGSIMVVKRTIEQVNLEQKETDGKDNENVK